MLYFLLGFVFLLDSWLQPCRISDKKKRVNMLDNACKLLKTSIHIAKKIKNKQSEMKH